MKLTTMKLESWGYSVVKVAPNFNRFWLIHYPCDGQTDIQTDGRTDGQMDGR